MSRPASSLLEGQLVGVSLRLEATNSVVKKRQSWKELHTQKFSHVKKLRRPTCHSNSQPQPRARGTTLKPVTILETYHHNPSMRSTRHTPVSVAGLPLACSRVDGELPASTTPDRSFPGSLHPVWLEARDMSRDRIWPEIPVRFHVWETSSLLPCCPFVFVFSPNLL